MTLLDTSVAIELRDGCEGVAGRVARVQRAHLSHLTWVELESGVHAHPPLAAIRRRATDLLLASFPLLPMDDDVVRTYGRIVEACGFSRSRVIDRLIAATALVHGLTLATTNAADFREIPGLRLEDWTAVQ